MASHDNRPGTRTPQPGVSPDEPTLRPDEAPLPTIDANAEDTASLRAPSPWTGPRPGQETVDRVLRIQDPPQACIDRFEQRTILAEGGMGRIELGRDPHLRRRVALKTLKHDTKKKRRAHDRFLVEMQVLAQLEHPGILPLYSAETTADGLPAFAMKYVQGGTLTDYLYRCVEETVDDPDPPGPCGLDERLELFVRICEAMQFAHERGVLHRDLKPDNIMLGQHRDTYITDWGIARVHGADEATEEAIAQAEAEDQTDASDTTGGPIRSLKTRYGRMLGTLTYMAPEQARGELDRLGPWSDQFSLGLILYFLVCLQPARDSFDGKEALVKVAREGTWRVPEHRHEHPIHPDLVAIIHKAAAEDPTDRYDSVADLADDVRRYMQREEILARPDTPFRRILRTLSQHPTYVLMGLIAMLALGSVTTIISLQQAVAAQQVAHSNALRLADLNRRVVRQAGAIDVGMAQIMVLLEGLGSQTRTLLKDARATTDASWSGPDAFATPPLPPGTTEHPRYHMPVTFERAVAVEAPDGDAGSMAQSRARLGPIEETFRNLMVGSLDRSMMQRTQAEKNRILREETPPVHVVYLGLEDGLLLNYPGYGEFDPAYDPRKRPWYRNVVGQRRPRWGPPYPDVSGSAVLVPCNLALYADGGTLLGVVGADMRLDDVIARLSMPGLPGFVEAFLLAEDGTIIARSSDAGGPIGRGLNDNQPVDRAPYPLDAIRGAVVDGQTGGVVFDGEIIHIHQQTSASGWTLVVQAERDAWVLTP